MWPWPQRLHGLFEVQRPVQMHTDVLCSFLKHWRLSTVMFRSRFASQQATGKTFLVCERLTATTSVTNIHFWLAYIQLNALLSKMMGWTLFNGGVQQWRKLISTVQPCTRYPPQISPQIVGCRKHWLACKIACGNCQDGDCDSVYCKLSQFPRIMDMKPKTLRQVVLTGYALYYDWKTHLSVNKTVSNVKHLQICTSSTVTNVFTTITSPQPSMMVMWLIMHPQRTLTLLIV